MSKCAQSEHKHIFKRLDWKRKKSGKKNEKAVDWYIMLLQRVEKDASDKWATKTMSRALARLKKYGLTHNNINEVLERRGKKDLLRKDPLY